MKKILPLLVVGILVLSGLGATAVTNIENNPPDAPEIAGPINGKVGVSYCFTFTTVDPDGDDVSYYIEWGDGTSTGWTQYFGSGEDVLVAHTWDEIDWDNIIRCKAKDIHGAEGNWSITQIPIMKNKDINLQSSSIPNSQSVMSVISSTGKTDVATSRTTFNDGTLSGYVNNTSMNPIEGALVRVYFHETYEENYTDSSGYYHVTNIPICYCMKNCTASKDGYKNEWVLLGIDENTTYDFVLYTLEPCYPVFNGTMGWNGWWISPVAVSFVFDPEDVVRIWYHIDDGDWVEYSEPFGPICEDDEHTVCWRYEDDEGNISDVECKDFKIDQTPPYIEEVEWETWKESWYWYCKFTCNATDNTSGMDRVEMYCNDGFHEINKSSGPIYEFVIELVPHFCDIVFIFKHYDVAGNSAIDSINESEITSFLYSKNNHFTFIGWLERFPILQKILDVLRLNIG